MIFCFLISIPSMKQMKNMENICCNSTKYRKYLEMDNYKYLTLSIIKNKKKYYSTNSFLFIYLFILIQL